MSWWRAQDYKKRKYKPVDDGMRERFAVYVKKRVKARQNKNKYLMRKNLPHRNSPFILFVLRFVQSFLFRLKVSRCKCNGLQDSR